MNRKTTKMLALLLVLVMVFSVGCSSKPAAAPAAEGSAPAAVVESTSTGETAGDTTIKSSKDTIVVANTSGEPANLHPYNIISIGASLVWRSVYNCLVLVDVQGNIQPELAESYEVADKMLTFKLNQGVKFHNGEEMKASDVKFSLQLAATGAGSQQSGNLASLDTANIETPDDYTVIVPMFDNDSSILGNLANIFIIPEKAYNEMGDDFQFSPVGTGPYKMKDWVVGDRIEVEAYDEYFQGAPRVKNIIFRTIAEASQAMIELETGGVDIMINPAGDDVIRVLNGEVPGIKAVTEASCVLRNNNLSFNWLSPHIQKHEVREAIARLIDRETWVNIISPGVGQPTYTPVANGVWGCDLTIGENYPYPYDVEKAKELLAAAGYNGDLELTLLTDARPYHQALVELLQASFAEAGITLNVQTMDLEQQKEIMVTGEGFDLYILDNVSTSGPSDFLSSIWRDSHPQFATTNSTHYRFYTVNDAQGQKYSDLMDQIRVTMDADARLELAHELQKVWVEDIVWVSVNSIQGYLLAADYVKEIAFAGDGLKVTNLLYAE